jgi:hypothetical protein
VLLFKTFWCYSNCHKTEFLAAGVPNTQQSNSSGTVAAALWTNRVFGHMQLLLLAAQGSS